MLNPNDLPFLGAGLGYRSPIHDQITAHVDDLDWLELFTDQFLPLTGERRERLGRLSAGWRCVPHGLELSVGGDAREDDGYLDQVAKVVAALDAPWFSDHLCFSDAGGVRLGHFAPLPWTREAALRVAERARRAQDHVGRPLLLENITYEFSLGGDLTEAQFIETVVDNAGCGLLLDVTNVHTNAVNHGFDAVAFLDAIPLERVVQLHVAGGRRVDGRLLDSHDSPVPEEVWELVDHVTARAPVRGILVERDDLFPADFGELLGEVGRARSALAGAGGVTAGRDRR